VPERSPSAEAEPVHTREQAPEREVRAAGHSARKRRLQDSVVDLP
jgi:hypothetical protein